MPSPSTQPSPVFFFETATAYQRSAALKTAVELDLFTAVAEGATTAEALAEKCRAAQRGIRILCDYLAIIGFLTKEGPQYKLTPDSAMFLSRRSPAYLANAVEFLSSSMLTDAFKDLTAAVRKGGTALPEQGSVTADNPVWVQFARSMANLSALPAQLIARLVDSEANQPLKVLDIAAGHGAYGIALAKHNPQAEIIALDWPGVLEVAKENARAAGVADRYSTIAGDAFEANFGRGYDLVMLTNILHHFDVPTCEKLLKKIHAALADGGRAVTVEFVPNEDRVSPPGSAGFSLIMLATTPSGDAYTFAQFDQMFRHAGFSQSELHQLPPGLQQVMISYK